MHMIETLKFDRAGYFYLVLQDPYCTRKAMQAINAGAGGAFQVHECLEKPDFSEPFGAILRHKRINTGYPICLIAEFLDISMQDLFRLEMGWMLPGPMDLTEILAGMALYYGFSRRELFRLVSMGEECRRQKPIDLSEYLGIELTEDLLDLMPREMRAQRPREYMRSKIRVIGKRSASGIEFPQRVIWSDGREFPIDKIDCAQERATFETGGVGTRFSCWLQGRQRTIGYEQPGEWFVETPRYA